LTQSRNLTCFIIALFVLFCEKVTAQISKIESEETRIAKIYSKLVSFIQSDYDSTGFYSDKFDKEFTGFIKANPATLDYPFRKLIDSNFCGIHTAGDKHFRIYSWDTWTGGTMHIFKSIYQWKVNGHTFTRSLEYEEEDATGFCSKIFTVDINRKLHYLVVTNYILSTKDAMQSISVYTIDGNSLIDTVKLFKTRTKALNTIDVDFDFFSVVDRPERPLELITYDEKQKIIYIPVVDEKGQVTKKNILYQLKGSYFKYIGIETGKRK
jgi:hypothetical protein